MANSFGEKPAARPGTRCDGSGNGQVANSADNRTPDADFDENGQVANSTDRPDASTCRWSRTGSPPTKSVKWPIGHLTISRRAHAAGIVVVRCRGGPRHRRRASRSHDRPSGQFGSPPTVTVHGLDDITPRRQPVIGHLATVVVTPTKRGANGAPPYNADCVAATTAGVLNRPCSQAFAATDAQPGECAHV